GLWIALVFACAGLALAQIGGFLTGSAETLSPLSRTLPVRIDVLGGPAKAARAVEGPVGSPRRPFDGYRRRGFVWKGEGEAPLRLLLKEPRGTAVGGAFGPADGRLTVSAEQEGIAVRLTEITPRSAGWSRVELPQPVTTRALLLDWQ